MRHTERDAVCVTGIGIVSPLGCDGAVVAERMRTGHSGIRRLEEIEPDRYRSSLGAKVEDFEPRDFIPAMKLRRMDDVSRMAVTASCLALADADLRPGEMTADAHDRVGVVFGTGYAAASHTDEFFCGIIQGGPSKANPLLFPNTVPNAPASLVAIHHGFRGPNTTFSQKETSGEDAMGYAADLLRRGRADVVLAGGGEELSPIVFHCLYELGMTSRATAEHDDGMRPYGAHRSGFVAGEGAAVLVLERLSSARERGARVRALVLGSGQASGISSAFNYESDPDGLEVSMRAALDQAGIGEEELSAGRGCVFAAANGSPNLDRAEAVALRRVLGEARDRVPVTAPKSLVGEMPGGGVLRAALAVLALEGGFVPPIPALGELDPACEGLDLVVGRARLRELDWVLLPGAAACGAYHSFVIGRGA